MSNLVVRAVSDSSNVQGLSESNNTYVDIFLAKLFGQTLRQRAFSELTSSEARGLDKNNKQKIRHPATTEAHL